MAHKGGEVRASTAREVGDEDLLTGGVRGQREEGKKNEKRLRAAAGLGAELARAGGETEEGMGQAHLG